MSKEITTLSPRDYYNLRYALSLSRDEFSVFFEELEDEDQKYLSALLETHRLDILDHAFNTGDLPKPNVVDILKKF